MLYVSLQIFLEHLQSIGSPDHCRVLTIANDPRLHSRCGESHTEFLNAAEPAQSPQLTKSVFDNASGRMRHLPTFPASMRIQPLALEEKAGTDLK
jgi:hypothetical protein